jgi:hypothetical protein
LAINRIVARRPGGGARVNDNHDNLYQIELEKVVGGYVLYRFYKKVDDKVDTVLYTVYLLHMRITLLYLGAILNLLLAVRALLTRQPQLFWWALGCGLLLALAGVLAEEGPSEPL